MPYGMGQMSSESTARSRLLNAFIYLHWAAPIGYLIAMAALYNLSLATVFSIFFSIYYIARSALTILVGWLLLQARPWAWHLFLLNATLIGVEQFYFAFFLAETHFWVPSLSVALFTLLLSVFLMRHEFRVPYYSPQIAWWESDPRYKISVPVTITTETETINAEIMDVSASGCFIRTRSNLTLEETPNLRFAIFDQEYSCRGSVVWKTDHALTHPRGVGIRFLGLKRQDYLRLKDSVKQLRNVSKKLRFDRREEKLSSIEEKLRSQR